MFGILVQNDQSGLPSNAINAIFAPISDNDASYLCIILFFYYIALVSASSELYFLLFSVRQNEMPV
jgi:hypothetical protein